jgi:hypothetical protein
MPFINPFSKKDRPRKSKLGAKIVFFMLLAFLALAIISQYI